MEIKKRFILALALTSLIVLTACVNTSTTNIQTSETDTSHIEQTEGTAHSTFDDTEIQVTQAEADMQSIIQNKAAKIGGEVLEYEIVNIDGYKALAVILQNNIYDYWYFTADSEELVLTTQLHMSHCVKHIEGGVTSLIVYYSIMSEAFPANIVTLVNGKPVIMSTYTDGGDFPALYYADDGDIVCMRGNGVSIGAVNVIPYYWDTETSTFEAYAIHEISINELKAMDTDNVVEDIDNVISVYQRDNGLIHVNYADIKKADINSTTTATRTYVKTGNSLRSYDSKIDAHYGFFLELLSVTE